MKKIAALFVGYSCCLLVTGIVHAQNLVPNPSFEEYSSCPDEWGQVYKAAGWYSYGFTPEYFHVCGTNYTNIPLNTAGNYPPTGDAFCGFYTYYKYYPESREIIGRPLSNPLSIGTKYYVSFKVNTPGGSCVTNNIGALFTTVGYDSVNHAPVNNFAHILDTNIISQINDWTTISGTFIADSAYTYISIGNFFTDTNTAFELLDGYECINAYYYLDDICVSSDFMNCDIGVFVNNNWYLSEIGIYPNPSDGKLFLQNNWLPSLNIKVFDTFGSIVYNKENYIGVKIDLTFLSSGLYIFELTNDDIHLRQKVLITK